MEERHTVEGAKRVRNWFVLSWVACMVVILAASRLTIEWAFVIFAVPLSAFVVTGINLLGARCSNCGASIFYRDGYQLLTLGMKWAPIWWLPMPETCQNCGLPREGFSDE